MTNYREFFKELFALILRCIGLIMLYYGLPLLYQVVGILIEEERLRTYALLHGAIFCLVGVWFLRGAPGFLSYCYPEERKKGA